MSRPPGTPPLQAGFLDRPFAHRALHDRDAGRPELSRAAVSAAVAAGFGIEIDLQLSADAVAMVFHDATLDRMTAERGAVRARSAADLGRIALTSSGDGIPSFAEILDLVAGRVPLLVELKDQTGDLGVSDGGLEQAAAADIAGYDGPLALMSFNPSMVSQIARHAPHLPRGRVTSPFNAISWPGVPARRRAQCARIEGLEADGVAFVSHLWSDLVNPRIAALKAAGLPILCWTVRSAREASRARAVADAVTFEGYLPD